MACTHFARRHLERQPETARPEDGVTAREARHGRQISRAPLLSARRASTIFVAAPGAARFALAPGYLLDAPSAQSLYSRAEGQRVDDALSAYAPVSFFLFRRRLRTAAPK